MEKFIDRDATKDAKKYIENWDLSGKQETLRAILTSKPCTEEELWERIKNTGRFSDKNRFIDYLRRAKSEGYIRRRTDGKLNWV